MALERLANKAIKESTYNSYLRTLKELDLEDVPFDTVTMPFLMKRLSGILNPGTRRKQTINLRAALGIKLPCPREQSREYDLPEVEEVHAAFEGNRYRPWAMAMLYAGLRLGESCIMQPIKGNVLTVDRQRLTDGSVSTPKTAGPVVVPEWFAQEYPHHDYERHHNTVFIGIKRAGKKAGLNLSPHLLRHLFATRLVNLGASPEILRRQMRHHSVAVSLKFYVETRQSDISSFMERF